MSRLSVFLNPSMLLKHGSRSGGLLRGMAILSGGTGLARVIGIISIPVLARVYSPEEFGVLSTFMAVIFFLMPIATLRYMQAIPLPRSERLAFALLVLCGAIATLFSSIVAMLLLAYSKVIFGLYSAPALHHFWWLVAIGMLGASLYETLSMWGTRKRAYSEIGRSQIVQSLAGEVLKLAIGLLGFKSFGLLLGYVAGQSGGAIHLLINFSNSFRHLWPYLRLSQLRHVALRYLGFPMYRLPAQLMLVFSTQAPIMFAALLYGAEVTGQLGLAMLFVALPMMILGVAISKVFYGEMASSLGNGLSFFSLRRSCFALFFLFFGISIGVILVSDRVVPFVLGSDWQQASSFISVLFVQVPFQMAMTPVLEIFNFLKQQHHVFLLHTLRATLIVISYFLSSVLLLSPNQFVMLVAASGTIFYILTTIIGLRLSRTHLRERS